MINIQANTQGLERAVKLLSHLPGGFQRAQRAALNRTLQHMKTQAVRLGREKYHAKSGAIRSTITTRRGANYGQMVSRGTRLGLEDYYLSPRKPRKKQKGINAAVKRDGIKSIPKGFIVSLGKHKDKYLPYIRVGKGRWDIKHLRSPAIPQILGNQEILDKIEQEAISKFIERLNHEVMRELNK